MGRNKEAKKTQLLIRVAPDLWLESIMLNPALQGETGYLRYGGISEYFTRLMRQDNERIKEALRTQTNGHPHSAANIG